MSLVDIYKNLALLSFVLSAVLFLICILLLTKGGAYKTIKGFLYKKNILKIDIQDDNYILENAVLENEDGGLLKNRDESEATALMNQEKEKGFNQDYGREQDETLPLYEESDTEETIPLEECINKEDEEQTAMLYDDGTDETMPLSLNITSTSKIKKEQEENNQKEKETRYANGTMILEHKIFCESKEI